VLKVFLTFVYFTNGFVVTKEVVRDEVLHSGVREIARDTLTDSIRVRGWGTAIIRTLLSTGPRRNGLSELRRFLTRSIIRGSPPSEVFSLSRIGVRSFPLSL
jgi:hypothetical protein